MNEQTDSKAPAKAAAKPSIPADVKAQARRMEKMAKDPAVQKVRAAVRAQGDASRAAAKSPPDANLSAFKRVERDADGNPVERRKR